MRKKYIGWVIFALLLLVLLVVAVLFSVSSGEVHIALSDIPSILMGKQGMEYFVLTQIRLPRILLAIAVGGSLGLTGSILQGVYRNPLVEPYTLGISGGASLGVALVIVGGLHSLSLAALPLAGFIGALVTIFVVYALSVRRGALDINRMLLIGVMISFVASSAMMLLMSVSTAEDMHSIVFWIMGSLDEPNLHLVYLMVGVSLFGLVGTYFFARPLNALRLGQSKAEQLGINASVAIRILFVMASLMAGICVSVAGIIGFVGLVIPHLVRMTIGSDYRISLLGSFLGGGLFLVVSDIVARTIIAPNELPIGVITGIIGGFIFMVVLSNMKRKPKLG